MAIADLLERLGRAVFESPFGANRIVTEAPELAEIRLLALDAVKENSHRVADQRVFAFNLVRIHLLGVPEEKAGVFEGEFLAQYFAGELKQGLRRTNFRFPPQLKVAFLSSPNLPQAGESWARVEMLMQEQERPAVNKLALVRVASGSAEPPELLLERIRTNIGRTADIYRSGGPARRNDLVFVGDDEITKTVSRQHAHILRDQSTNEYRLMNDRIYRGEENCGVWLVRDGLSRPVHRSTRGARLEHGDEIHIGRAILHFEQS